jgi:hypothetical protein
MLPRLAAQTETASCALGGAGVHEVVVMTDLWCRINSNTCVTIEYGDQSRRVHT